MQIIGAFLSTLGFASFFFSINLNKTGSHVTFQNCVSLYKWTCVQNCQEYGYTLIKQVSVVFCALFEWPLKLITGQLPSSY